MGEYRQAFLRIGLSITQILSNAYRVTRLLYAKSWQVTVIGVTLAASGSTTATELYKPYAESHVNFLYNLLFCDDINLFKTQGTEKSVGLWGTLLAERPDKTALRKVADDETNEGRVRAVAYNRLRTLGEAVAPKRLLGVVVEVPFQQGLDVLAAFSEGGVRYLNQSGKVAIFEGQGNPVEGLAKELVLLSQPLVNKIGPWDKQRLPPPKSGNVRITFLVSDGLYFGEGPFAVLQQDAMAGPVLSKATQLLQRVVALGTQ
ncbi:MAG: hypothetical protein JNK99_02610 [Candidatus Accumulibacter sp.]|uniref:hypothetical protein n=1 Tax=Accumulibacter sp. TaxID=2053492 RepID=UPI001A3D87C8|nr:hypothetical protein [Accumulibacter sp.]MBL8393630.1 hypothetical protein [Accumulibacter sp.]